MVTIVGGDTLLGRELRDGLKERRLDSQIELLAAEEQISVLTEDEDEPLVLAPLDAGVLTQSSVVFCTGSRQSARRAYELGAGGEAVFVDLTYGLDDDPRARLRSPLNEELRAAGGDSKLLVVAHPAASAIALVMAAASRTGTLRHSVVHVFEPASERGQAGINELQNQTTGLLSFRKLEKKVFDSQIAFNLLAQYGDEAPEALTEIEQRIDRHLATLLSQLQSGVGLPSLRLIQAPVFHGYSLSFWLEFESRVSLEALRQQLEDIGIDVRGSDLESPNNVGVAGQSGVSVGAIETDRNKPNGFWLWAVADNLKLQAENAIDAARPYLGETR